MAIQPDNMKNDFGVILSIGLFANGEPFEIVQPMCSESTTISKLVLCQDAVESWIAAMQTDFLACFAETTSLVFVQAEGMVNGRIPYRQNFAIGGDVGTLGTATAPTNTSALGLFYADPDDIAAGDQMRIAKNFFSGIALEHINQNDIDTTLSVAIGNYIDGVQSGYDSLADSSAKWWRVLQVPKPRTQGQTIKRTANSIVRVQLYTQKRRFVPRM